MKDSIILKSYEVLNDMILLKWNGKNLTSGLYFIMVQSGNTKRVKRVTYLK